MLQLHFNPVNPVDPVQKIGVSGFTPIPPYSHTPLPFFPASPSHRVSESHDFSQSPHSHCPSR